MSGDARVGVEASGQEENAEASRPTSREENQRAPKPLFNEEHAEYLSARAVPLELAYAAGVRSASGGVAAQALQRPHPIECPCLVIVYRDHQPTYVRVRLDDPEVAGGARYLAPAGRDVPVYLPQLPVPKFAMKVAVPHADPASALTGHTPAVTTTGESTAVTTPPPDALQAPPDALGGVLCVVESPIKALAVLGTGIDAVGLGGVGTTLTKKDDERRLNDSWKAVKLKDREVIVVFDAGRATNANVARAEGRLAQALAKSGAKVKVAALPLNDEGSDQGPDDYIASKGPKAFWDVLERALPADPVERVEAEAAHLTAKTGSHLIDDLSFLLSVHGASLGTQRLVKEAMPTVGVKPGDFNKAMARAAARLKSTATASSEKKRSIGDLDLGVVDGCIAVISRGENEEGDFEARPELLSNFTAIIEEEIIIDDGVEEKRELVLCGRLADGGVLPRARMDLASFKDPLWAQNLWGPKVQTAPDPSTNPTIRLAIQQGSNPKQTRDYATTGWRQLLDAAGEPSGLPVFLHAGGAVGAEGVQVSLLDTLNKYRLPSVADDPVDAVRLSLELLDVATRTVTLPLLAAVYRAPLQSVLYADFTLAPVGKSGTQKTTTTNLMAAHFGAALESGSGANWHDTAAAIENKLFLARDCLLVIDDFAPKGNTGYDQLHAKAETILRSIGNRSARARMRADLTARISRPPQALVVSTGEDVPAGESIRARMVPLFFTPKTVNLRALSDAQLQVPRLAHAMTAYLLWLRPRMDGLAEKVAERHRHWRELFRTDGCHLRAPAALAHLMIGWEMLTRFAVEVGALTDAKAKRLVSEGIDVLAALGSGQRQNVDEVDPPTRFIDVLRDLVVQGKALLRTDLKAPLAQAPLVEGRPTYGSDPERGQQREREIGVPVGWMGDDEIYLLKDPTFRIVIEALSGMREQFPLAPNTLWRRLRDSGRIKPSDRDEHLTRRVRVGPFGRPEVIVMPRSTLFPDDVATAGGNSQNETLPPGNFEPRELLEPEAMPHYGPDADETDHHAAGGPSSEGKPVAGAFDGPRGAAGAMDSGAPHTAVAALASGPPQAPNRPSERPNRTTKGPKRTTAEGEVEKKKTEIVHTPPPSPSTPGRLGQLVERGEGLVEAVDKIQRAAEEEEKSMSVGVSPPGRTGPTGPSGPSTYFLEPDPESDRPLSPAYQWRDGPGLLVPLRPGASSVLAGAEVVVHDGKRACWRLVADRTQIGALRCLQTSARLLTGASLKAATFEQLCKQFLNQRATPSLLPALDGVLKKELSSVGLERVAKLEFELLPVVARMELTGVGVNVPAWKALVAEKRKVADQFRGEVVAAMGVKNPDDDAQVLAALRGKGVPVTRTAGEVLFRHLTVPGVAEFLEYRRLTAFLNDIGRKMLEAVTVRDGRVHPSYDPLAAATGRFGCSGPNLFSLPKEPEVRRCVVPAKTMVFVVADYAAIELRVLAHVTGDENLQAVFQRGGDPHRHTASLFLGKPESEVTEEERQRAKPVNFGLAFGMGDQGLVDHAAAKYGLTITLAEAKRFRAAYLKAYPKVAAWQKRMQRDAPLEVRTASGRRRVFKSKNTGYCERLATEVQGSAADGMKCAMVLLGERLPPLGARIVLGVHDELVVEAPADHAEQVRDVLDATMVEGMKRFITTVPIVVEASIRSSWAKADVLAMVLNAPRSLTRTASPVEPRRGSEQLPMFHFHDAAERHNPEKAQ